MGAYFQGKIRADDKIVQRCILTYNRQIGIRVIINSKDNVGIIRIGINAVCRNRKIVVVIKTLS